MSRAWTPSQHGADRGSLQKRVARGLLWTLIDTWGSQAIGFVIFAILAHLLTADQFGLVALAAVFVALGQLFADQGLGDAVIQRPTLTRLQLDTAFWAAVATGAALFGVGFVLSGPVATVLGDARLQPILQVLSLVFVFVAFASIQMGILRREMDFRSLAIRKLLAVAAGGVVGVGMALAGYGAWSLVGQQVASALVSVIMLWAASPFRPAFAFSWPDFRSMFGFGANVVGSDLLGFFARNTDNLLIGVFLGTVSLGYYAVAYRILDTSQILLIAAARRLVFPSFARLQHDPGRARRAYLRLTRSVSALTLPGYVGLALVAPEAIVTVFGQKWEPAGLAASVLFLVGPVLTVQAFSGAVWNAVGHPEVTLRFRFISTLSVVAGFAVAVLFFRDIVAVAAAFTIPGYILLPLNLYWMRLYGGVSVRDQLWQLRKVALSVAVMAAAVVLVKFGLGAGVHHIVLLIAETAAGVLAFGIALFLVDRPLVRDLIVVGSEVVPGGERIARRLGVPIDAADVEPAGIEPVDVGPLTAVATASPRSSDDLIDT